MSEEEIKKEVLKAVELYAEGGRNPSGGQGKKLSLNGPQCPTMKKENS